MSGYVVEPHDPNHWTDPKSRPTLSPTVALSLYIYRIHMKIRDIDIQKRSTLGLCNLHHRTIRAQNWGFYLLDPPGGVGRGPGVASYIWTYSSLAAKLPEGGMALRLGMGRVGSQHGHLTFWHGPFGPWFWETLLYHWLPKP